MKDVEVSPAEKLSCPNCARLAARVAELEAELAALRTQLKRAEKRNCDLELRLRQNSRNTHRPPSSDAPGTPRPPRKPPSGRKRGGQLGHKGKNRSLLPLQEVDRVVRYAPESCEQCHAPLAELKPDDKPVLRHQTVELREDPCEVTEHQAFGKACTSCGHFTVAKIPDEVGRSAFGPRLTALGSLLTGGAQVSRRGVREIFTDVLGVPISLGTVSNMEAEVTKALEAPYRQAGEAVRGASAKNIDETGWKHRNSKAWLWGAATSMVAFFVIHASRGYQGLKALLGNVFRGTFSSDRWKAYCLRARRFRQICWAIPGRCLSACASRAAIAGCASSPAILVRDFRKLVDMGGVACKLGKKAQELAGYLFLIWNDFKKGFVDRATLQDAMRPVRKDFRVLLKRGVKLKDPKPRAFFENLLDLEPALWTFLRVDGVEPTNNHAERILRTGVLWRKRGFGSRSERGARFAERILTVVLTCRLQGKRAFPFLVEAIAAHRARRPAPSLLTADSATLRAAA